jgi:hypothetical protein
MKGKGQRSFAFSYAELSPTYRTVLEERVTFYFGDTRRRAIARGEGLEEITLPTTISTVGVSFRTLLYTTPFCGGASQS